MFGYVTINKPELKIKEYYRYKGYYCGLCKTLKQSHGRLGQFTLTYDMTFLIVLLTSLYEVKTEASLERCFTHPTKKHPVLVNEITEYASDMNIALAFHNFVDDWMDDKSIKGLTASHMYFRRYQQVEQKYTQKCKVIKKCLRELHKLEKENSQNIDEVAGCFGNLMAELFVYRHDEWEDTLRTVGFYLGKFIYLMDAYEDLEEDKKEKHYNPLIKLSEREDFKIISNQMLTMMMAECTRAMERLPLVIDIELLRNILYAGVWSKYDKHERDNNE